MPCHLKFQHSSILVVKTQKLIRSYICICKKYNLDNNMPMPKEAENINHGESSIALIIGSVIENTLYWLILSISVSDL